MLQDNGATRYHVDATKSRSSLVGALHGLTELVELQFHLMIADLKTVRQRLIAPLIAGAVGICLGIGIVPVLWIAFAELLRLYAEMSRVSAYSVSALVGCVCAAIALYVSWRGLQSSTGELKKSVNEMQTNLQCIREVLTSPQSPHSPRFSAESLRSGSRRVE
jgi:hypothetical protein